MKTFYKYRIDFYDPDDIIFISFEYLDLADLIHDLSYDLQIYVDDCAYFYVLCRGLNED